MTSRIAVLFTVAVASSSGCSREETSMAADGAVDTQVPSADQAFDGSTGGEGGITRTYEIDVHQSVACAVRPDGSVLCWGNGIESQLATPPDKEFKQVSVGTKHVCALKVDGSLRCWGSNECANRKYCGQLDSPEGSDFLQVASGDYHSLAVRADGTLAYWGSPATPLPEGNDFVQVCTRHNNSCARRAGGTLTCFGSIMDPPVIPTPPQGDDFIDIFGGDGGHLCALRKDHSAVCWPSTADLAGETIPPAGETFLAVAPGKFYTMSITADGRLLNWGGFWYSDPYQPNLTTPDPPSADARFIRISAGYNAFCAVTTDNQLGCWGTSHYLTELPAEL